MPYTPTSWTSGTTPVDAPEMNNLETQYTESTLSLNPDFGSGAVVSGFVATKDGTIATKLDVTSGIAYLKQADGSYRQRKPAASNQTTSVINTTYHLYLQPDGTWYWSTSNSPAANSLAIANVTTDGSGNILAVSDQRNRTITIFPGATGTIAVPNNFQATGQVSATGGVFDNGVRVAIQGTHSAGQPKLSYGAGVPGTLDVNEVYFQVS